MLGGCGATAPSATLEAQSRLVLGPHGEPSLALMTTSAPPPPPLWDGAGKGCVSESPGMGEHFW